MKEREREEGNGRKEERRKIEKKRSKNGREEGSTISFLKQNKTKKHKIGL